MRTAVEHTPPQDIYGRYAICRCHIANVDGKNSLFSANLPDAATILKSRKWLPLAHAESDNLKV